MSYYGDESIPFTCPNPKCKKDLSTKISDVVNRRKVHCSRCGSEIIFNSIAISNLRHAISELERARVKLTQAMSQLTLKAELKSEHLKLAIYKVAMQPR